MVFSLETHLAARIWTESGGRSFYRGPAGRRFRTRTPWCGCSRCWPGSSHWTGNGSCTSPCLWLFWTGAEEPCHRTSGWTWTNEQKNIQAQGIHCFILEAVWSFVTTHVWFPYSNFPGPFLRKLPVIQSGMVPVTRVLMTSGVCSADLTRFSMLGRPCTSVKRQGLAMFDSVQQRSKHVPNGV